MRIPVPTDRLVALTLLGVVLTGAVAASLAAPGVLPGPTGGEDPAALPDDGPTPNPDFTPAVQNRPAGEDEWEDEAHEDDEEDEQGEDEWEDEVREDEEEDGTHEDTEEDEREAADDDDR